MTQSYQSNSSAHRINSKFNLSIKAANVHLMTSAFSPQAKMMHNTTMGGMKVVPSSTMKLSNSLERSTAVGFNTNNNYLQPPSKQMTAELNRV